MSAYVVSRDHVDAVVRAGLAPGRGYGPLRWFTQDVETMADCQAYGRELRLETADAVGQMLADENVRSVAYRYPDDGELPGTYGADGLPDWFTAYHYSPFQHGRCPTPVEALKLLDCLEYQSCEHPGWRESEACRFCEAFRRRLIGELPGYDAAPWEWSRVAS